MTLTDMLTNEAVCEWRGLEVKVLEGVGRNDLDLVWPQGTVEDDRQTD